LYHINVGRTQRDEGLISAAELAFHTTRNADTFFQFGLGAQ